MRERYIWLHLRSPSASKLATTHFPILQRPQKSAPHSWKPSFLQGAASLRKQVLLCENAHKNVRFHCFETTFLYQSIKHMYQTIDADDACWSVTSPPLHPSIDSSCDRKRITAQQGRMITIWPQSRGVFCDVQYYVPSSKIVATEWFRDSNVHTYILVVVSSWQPTSPLTALWS